MIININKPKNWTSFDVVAKFRGLTGIKKVGHAGTLDPLATGVLLLLTGRERKKQQELMSLPKIYEGVIAFGATTDTYDLEGSVVISDIIPTQKELEEKLPKIQEKYLGTIEQKVPAYSAKKVDGKPLYKRARKGNLDLNDLPTKKITIDCFEISDFDELEIVVDNKRCVLPTVKCRICCSSGTYIRSIAHDLGQDMGCGALLASLVRLEIGPYKLGDSKTLEEIEAQLRADPKSVASLE